MLHGETPRHCGDLIYAYPPFFALLWTPLVPMPELPRVIIWYLVIIGTIVVSLRLCETLVRLSFPQGWSDKELATVRILTFVLAFKFMLSVLSNQAYDSLALVFVLLGLVALLSERSLVGGASLAMAAAIKVTPLVFLPYLLFKGRFAAAAVFAVVLAFLSLLPDILLPPNAGWHIAVWVQDVVLAPLRPLPPDFDLPFWVTDSPLNQSFSTALVRLFTGVHEQQPFDVIFAIMRSRAFAIALYSVTGGYVLVVGCVMLISRRNDRLIAFDGALLIASALLLSPVTSQSHFIGLMLSQALLSAAVIKQKVAGVFNLVMLIFSFAVTTALSNDLVGRNVSGWAVWNNLPVYGVLLLVVPLASFICSSERRYKEAPVKP